MKQDATATASHLIAQTLSAIDASLDALAAAGALDGLSADWTDGLLSQLLNVFLHINLNKGMEAAVEAAVAPEVVVIVDDDYEEEQQQQPEGAGAEAGLQRGRSKKRRRRREEERRRSLAPEEQTLRLRVSELACVVGHHPYQCIVEAVMNHLYQGTSRRAGCLG